MTGQGGNRRHGGFDFLQGASATKGNNVHEMRSVNRQQKSRITERCGKCDFCLQDCTYVCMGRCLFQEIQIMYPKDKTMSSGREFGGRDPMLLVANIIKHINMSATACGLHYQYFSALKY